MTKNARIELRCTDKDKNKIKSRALIYCEGNINEYLIKAGLSYIPTNEDNIKKKRPKKGPLKKKSIKTRP